MLNQKHQRGFTFVELMIVLGVILILSAVAIMSLNSSRAMARDAKRLADVRRIQTALEFYNAEENAYPAYKPVSLGQLNTIKLCDSASGAFVDQSKECKITYIYPIPTDPLSGGSYIYSSDGKGYDLTFKTEKNTEIGAAGIYHAHAMGIDQRAGLK